MTNSFEPIEILVADSTSTNEATVRYEMITPLIRLKIETEQITLDLTSQIHIHTNNQTIFDRYNLLKIEGRTLPLFSGTSRNVFLNNPLLVCDFPCNNPFQAPNLSSIVLDNFLISLALFKTTNTKLKEGPKITIPFSSSGKGILFNVNGSDDSQDHNAQWYELSKEEWKEFKDFYTKLKPLLEVNDEHIKHAINFYTKASRTEEIIEKFIFLIISLEALFSSLRGGIKQGITYGSSLLLGETFEARSNIQKVTGQIYEKRSKLFHGSSSARPTVVDFRYLNEIIRTSILQYLSLFSLGHDNPTDELSSLILKQDQNEYRQFQSDKLSVFGKISNFRYNNIVDIKTVDSLL